MSGKPTAPQASPSSYTTSDIENGRLPVLSPEEIQQAELAQKQRSQNTEPDQYVNPPIAFATETSSSSPTSAVYNRNASAPIESVAVNQIGFANALDQSQPAAVGTSTTTGSNNNQMPNNTNNTTTTTNNITINSREPVTINVCPYCKTTNVKTRTVTSPDIITVIFVIALLLVFWPLFWLPLCCGQCKKTKHYCTKCNNELDTIETLSDCCSSTK